MTDWPDAEALRVRVERVEGILRSRQMHEADCPVERARKAQKWTDSYMHVPDCTCWLGE